MEDDTSNSSFVYMVPARGSRAEMIRPSCFVKLAETAALSPSSHVPILDRTPILFAGGYLLVL